MNYFEELNKINVNDKVEKKNGLTYLSWSWAWAELKKRYPKSFRTVYENAQGWNYFTDGKTAWCKVGVTLVADEGETSEHIEYLPVMDFRNKSIPIEQLTSFEVNKTIMRATVKAIANVCGLGLYIYAGEDLPEEEKAEIKKVETEKIDKASLDTIHKMCQEKGVPIHKICETYGVQNLADLTKKDWISAMKRLDKTVCKAQESA